MFEPVKNDLVKITEINATSALPELLKTAEEEEINTPEAWAARREELMGKAVEYQFGKILPAPSKVTVEHLNYNKALSPKNYRVICEKDGKTLSFTLRLFAPTGEGPFPVIVDGDMGFHYAYDTDFVKTVLRNGCALALFDRTELAADTTNEHPGKFGPIFDLFPEADFGTISAWAWGYSRVVDALEILCENELATAIDLNWVVFSGHSRGGKTALLAGICDTRAAVVNPNEAGCGGTGCHRVTMRGITEEGQTTRSETLLDITRRFPDWFGQKLIKHAGKEHMIPYDEHFLKAMIAPRILLIGSAASDIWANPVGTVITNRAAEPVFELLGAKEKLLWYFRPGKHAHKEEDVEVLANVIHHFRDGAPLWDGFGKLPYEETGDPFLQPATIEAPWKEFPCYRLTPDATPDEMRQMAIKAQHDELTVPWRPERDMIYSKQVGGHAKKHYYYQNTAYVGLPYTAGGTGLLSWMEFIDPETGIIPEEYVDDLCYKHGNSCAASVSWGEAAVVPSSQRCIATHSFVYKNGWFPLGEVEYDRETESFAKMGTDEILVSNGDEKVLESYALTKPADVVVATHDLTAPRLANGKRRTGNHCMMVLEPPVVVRDENGKLDPEKSYVIVQDQWATNYTVEDARKPMQMRGHVYKTQSFASLLEEKYIAITCAEYLGLKKYENAWAKADRDVTDVASLLEAVIQVNFRITAVYLKVTAEGETVFSDKYVLLSREVLESVNEGFPVERAVDTDALVPVLTELGLNGKTAQVKLSVRVATGEELTVAEFEA